jgi:hypothetical protein
MRKESFILPWAFLLGTFILNSCSVNQEDISGIYIIKGLNNSLNTLKILRNGAYIRILYKQDEQRLLFQNTDKWKYDGSRIQLYNYLPDEDEKHSPEEVLGLGTMLCDLPIRKRFGKIVIAAPRTSDDEVLYEKL